MKEIPFEYSQKMWCNYMVTRIFHNLVYPNLNVIPILSYEEFIKPDMYFIDGINKVELPFTFKGKQYFSSDIETFNEWYSRI